MVKTLYNLFEFCKAFPPKKAEIPSDLSVGDVVVCFADNVPKKCGTVRYIATSGQQKLPRNHPDGHIGEVFVLDSSRATTKRNTPFTGSYLPCCLFYLLLL